MFAFEGIGYEMHLSVSIKISAKNLPSKMDRMLSLYPCILMLYKQHNAIL